MNNQQGGQHGGHQQGGFGQKNAQPNQTGKQAMTDKDKNVKQSKDTNKGGSCG